MEDQTKSIVKDMEETRTSMTEKLEALESHVVEKVKPVTDAVERVSEAAATMVENVKETVHEVTSKVEKTAQAVSSAFDVRQLASRNPWVVFGIALTTGCLTGSLLRRPARRSHASSSATSGRHKHAKGTNGASHLAETPAKHGSNGNSSSKPKDNWFGQELEQLKGLAVGALMSYVRDLARTAIPGALGSRIAQEVETMTTRMGAEPIHGDVLGAFTKERSQEQPESTHSGIECSQSPEVVNRMRSGSSGTGLR